MNEATIFVRLTVPGFHAWPDAPHHRAYLRFSHRHMFHIEVRCEVTHDDREIEYHDLMDLTRGFVAESAETTETCSFGSMSCEQIARRLGIKLSEKYERP